MVHRCWLIVGLLLPAAANAWLPGPLQPDATGGFVVDRSRRNDVLGFHRNIHEASDGAADRMGWTGNHAGHDEGTVSQEFVDDVRRRINYYRALVGVPANVTLNNGALVLVNWGEPSPPSGTTKQAASQRAALMFSLAGSVSHDPPNAPPFAAWTLAAWNAARHGNLALGLFGVEAIDAYMRENEPASLSPWVSNAGHRRWLMLASTTNMATGDVPASGSSRAANVLYVMPRPEEVVDQPPAFVAWPAAGYFPQHLRSVVWSLSYPGANFSAATVQMTGPQGDVPVTIIDRTTTGMGDPAIIWVVPASVANGEVTADVDYQVTVSGIAGAGVPSVHSYTVRLFDPERVNESLELGGPSVVDAGGGDFTFAAVDAAESHTIDVREVLTSDWLEGAEDAGMVIDGTSPGYALFASISWNGSKYWNGGDKAFRLAFDRFVNPPTEDFLELGRDLLPVAGGQLLFSYRRGFMAPGTSLAVEASTDDGLTWQPIAAPVSGHGNGAPDSSFTDAAVDLPSGLGPVRVRFVHRWENGTPFYSVQSNPGLPVGIFIDDIRATGSAWLLEKAVVDAGIAGSWHFDEATSGVPLGPGKRFALRMRPEFGGRPMAWGPSKLVSVGGQVGDLSGDTAPPVTGASYSFAPQPGATGYQVSVMRVVASPWSEGAEVSPVPRVVDMTSHGYSLYNSKLRKSGKRSFRLASQSGAAESFEIDRRIVPSASSELVFAHRALDLLNTQALHGEVSTDGGAVWASVWSTRGSRYYSGKRLKGGREGAWTTERLPLGGFAGSEVRVRFVLYTDAGTSVPAVSENNKVGIWIDDIAVSGAEEVVQGMVSTLSAAETTFMLDGVSAGGPLVAGATYRLRFRVLDAGGAGPWGPVLEVVPVP